MVGEWNENDRSKFDSRAQRWHRRDQEANSIAFRKIYFGRSFCIFMSHKFAA
ncbi:hypothetical protein FACS1894122_10620 [Alphaproteobacteria bacterium]|nr:hypothetical protein FACS1894122_10620 [Alphaproteobacteria bacterium]